MRLSEKYGERAPDEWPMLFQRILQNAIRDYYRRSKVRSLWTTLLSSLSADEDENGDPLETLATEIESEDHKTPHRLAERTQLIGIIEKEISKLDENQFSKSFANNTSENTSFA